MLVDINRYDVARPQPIRVVKAAVDRFDLCLDRGFFSRAHRLARTERARVGKHSLAALLCDRARTAFIDTGCHGLRLMSLRSDWKHRGVKTHQRYYCQTYDSLCHNVSHFPATPPRILSFIVRRGRITRS